MKSQTNSRFLRRILSPALAAGVMALAFCPGSTLGADGDSMWGVTGVTLPGGASDFQHISDGTGGTIVAYSHSGAACASRISATGSVLWGPVQLSAAGAQTSLPRLCSDGCGGALVAWAQEVAAGTLKLCVQRVSGSGAAQWASPVDASGSFADITPALAVAPGQASAFLVYRSDVFLYATHITAAGVLSSPGAAGLYLGTARGYSAEPSAVPSGSTGTGVIVAWANISKDMVAQKVVVSGGAISAAWNSGSPVNICATSGDAYYPCAAPDGAGGALMAWTELTLVTKTEIRVQKINSSGVAQWSANGVVLVDSTVVGGSTGWQSWETASAVASDGSGGAYVAWNDWRNDSSSSGNDDIYAQRVNASGAAQWTSGGISLPQYAPGSQRRPKMASDLAGGALVTFQDKGGWSWDISLVKLTTAGKAWAHSACWDSHSVSDPGQDQYNPAVVYDASGVAPKGCIVAWTEEFTIAAAQKVELSWVPRPALAAIDPNASPLTLTLQWEGSGYVLEEASSIPNWANSDASVSCVGNSCQATDSTIGSTRFYRLRDDSKGFAIYGDPVGYIALALPGGWSATSNPFERLPGANKLNDLFKLADAYTWSVIFKWDTATSAWIWSVYTGAALGWWPNLELPLGEGVAFGTAAGLPLTMHMAGPLAVGHPVIHLPAGFAIAAPPWPVSQALENVNFPPKDWDWVFTFENSTGAYFGYCCLAGVWWPWDFTPPAGIGLSLCESFWSWRAAPMDWVGVCPASLP